MTETRMVLINPPADVQNNLNDLAQSCLHWLPTEVSILPPPASIAEAWPPAATVCRLLTDPEGVAWGVFWQITIADFIILTAVLSCILITKAYKIPGFLIRQITRRYVNRYE